MPATHQITLAAFTMLLLALSFTSAAQPAPSEEELFGKRCAGCHALDRNKEGPRLSGVYGRKAGSLDSYEYSDALKASGVVWNDQTLDEWLTGTEKLVPGNDMTFSVAKPEERRAIILFLKQVSGK